MRNESKIDEALNLFELALSYYIDEDDSFNIANTYNLLGTTYRRNNQKRKALQSFYESIRINKVLNNFDGLVANYNNLANYYSVESSYQLAYEYYKLAEQILEDTSDKKKLMSIQLNLAILFSYKDSGLTNYDSAIIYNLKSLELSKELRDSLSISFLYNNLGFLYEKNNNLKAALTSYYKSIETKVAIADSNGLAVSYLNVGNAYLKLENFEKSIEFYEKSLALKEYVGDPNHDLHVLSNLVKAKMGVGKVEEASALFLKYNQLRDSLFDKEKMQEIKDLETKYETERKEEEIRRQEMAIREKTFQSNIFLGLSILLVILMLSTIFFFLQKQEYVKKLKNEEIATMKTEQELKELNAMMHGQEEERNRIASDLHDRLGARLSSIKLLFQSDDSQEMKLKVLDSINEAIKETREISHNLSTDMLTRFGIDTAIKDIVRSINDAGQIQADFESYGMQERLPLEIERNIYHVALELINNTLKHAQASHLMVQISCVDDEINVFYEDNGIGFDPQQFADSGMGLRSIYARMNAVKGAVYVNSKPGKGINVVLSIPLSQQKNSTDQLKREKLA
ncbi:two-component sensor histidine kinase [Marivirga lumbricoides]|uniref:histidine kinase n=1 Tax=Marivirga lumbricoides TaxID=1046115 RepID=A0ABQ1N1B1_9BACT|nr:two-component sensor histidine kinase [Marivirga lumbricoides]